MHAGRSSNLGQIGALPLSYAGKFGEVGSVSDRIAEWSFAWAGFVISFRLDFRLGSPHVEEAL